MSMAIITGASAGMGREFVRAVMKHRPEIDEFLLIARRKDRLDAMAAEMSGKTVYSLPLDLTDQKSFDVISDFLKEKKSDVRLLINNAGFGTLGNLEESDPHRQADMAALNCGALTALCVIVSPYIKKGGAILNVSSIASFVPTPRMTTYSATKAYVSSLSRALRSELKPRGVNVMALCPGPMDTEFLDVAGISGGRSPMFGRIPHISAGKVADEAVVQVFKGKAVYTPTLFYKFYRVLAKILPKAWLVDSMTC